MCRPSVKDAYTYLIVHAYSESGRDAKHVHSVAWAESHLFWCILPGRRLLLIVVTFGLPHGRRLVNRTSKIPLPAAQSSTNPWWSLVTSTR